MLIKKVIFGWLLPICWWWEGCHWKDQDEISSKTTFSSSADDYRPSKFQFNNGQKNMFFHYFFNIFEIYVFVDFSMQIGEDPCHCRGQGKEVVRRQCFGFGLFLRYRCASWGRGVYLRWGDRPDRVSRGLRSFSFGVWFGLVPFPFPSWWWSFAI